jgi:hypothetical protein
MIVVGQDRRVPFDGIEPGDVYIVLSYLENRVNAEAGAPKGAPANRIVESYKIETQDKPAEEPTIELARIRWTAVDAQVKPAKDASNPAPDEIDLRFRQGAQVARPATINIGVVGGEGNAPNLHGISNLMREIDSVNGFHSRFRGNINLEDGAGGSDFLVLSAPASSEAALTTLASHLGRGGALLADACNAVPGEEFAKAVQQMADRLGLRLKTMDAGDLLLNARYPFSEPPEGAKKGTVTSSGRFVLSQRDYACAWSGICQNDALPRETVRAALEWGVNVAIGSIQPPIRGAP